MYLPGLLVGGALHLGLIVDGQKGTLFVHVQQLLHNKTFLGWQVMATHTQCLGTNPLVVCVVPGVGGRFHYYKIREIESILIGGDMVFGGSGKPICVSVCISLIIKFGFSFFVHDQ